MNDKFKNLINLELMKMHLNRYWLLTQLFGFKTAIVLYKFFSSGWFTLGTNIALMAMASYLTLRNVPVYDLPIEVPEEAKLMCSNSVHIKSFTSIRGDIGKGQNGYLIYATCANGDRITRAIKIERS